MRLSLISSLFHKRLFAEVIRLIDKSKVNFQGNHSPKILYYLALSYTNLGNTQLALEYLDKVIVSNLGISFNYQCHMLKGYMFTMRKDYDEAISEFEGLLHKGYESSMVYGALGHVAFHLKQNDEALTYLEKALSLDPQNINALNSLSYLLVEYNIDLTRASKCIEKALELDPRNPSYLDTYGYILFKLNKFKDAKKILEYAFTLKPHETIKQHLQSVNKALLEKKQK